MFATINAHRRLIIRLLPLAAVLIFMALLLPADLVAFADISKPPAKPAANPVSERSVPAPVAIKQPITMGASALGTSIQKTASDQTTASAPTTARPWVTTAVAAEQLQVAAGKSPNSAIPPGLNQARIAAPVNMRTGPSKSSATLSVLPAGTEVAVAETVRGWVHIYTEGSEGWVYATYLSGGAGQVQQPRIAKYEAAPPARTAPKARLQVQTPLQVRAEPGGDPIYQLDPGEQVAIAEVRGKWARIVTASGESGWVRVR